MRKWVLALLCMAVVLPPVFFVPQAAAADSSAAPAVVINEIHYAPLLKTAHVEFVELYNPSAQAVDLTGWSLTKAADYVFPAGTMLSPGGFLVVSANPANMRTVYGVTALGPFAGRLSNDGDKVVVRDRSGNTIDEVDYQMGFPWPIPPEDVDRSIGLINFNLDNAQPGAWRSSLPTPGRANSDWVDNPSPFVDAVEHMPSAPTTKDTITIRAHVTDADGIAAVRVYLQLVAPGSYIRLTDRDYQSNWFPIPMLFAGNDVYVAQLPTWMRLNRYLIRYRIEAVDKGRRSITVPYQDDPQPNFALYIYDGVPPWRGAVQPAANGQGGRGRTDYDFASMRPLPVYQLIAQEADIEDSQFIPKSPYSIGYMGDDYLWLGTLVIDGVVYDHIRYRARGGIYRYSVGKNNWKFSFNRGHSVQGYDDYGKPYPVKWDKLNFSSVIKHANRYYRGEQGLFETMAYRLFNLFGVPASNTNFLHFRVVDGVEQSPPNQYAGDFWGLYLGIENMDGEFLDQHGLPDGNLYEMKDWTGSLDNLGYNGVGDKSDLNRFIAAYQSGSVDAGWWQKSFDLEGYYRFRAVLEAVHHYDVDQGKNYDFFFNPELGKWQILPWDLDLTWAENLFGEGNEPFRDRVLTNPAFNVDYQNAVRELRDLLFNRDQIYPMIDEVAAVIDSSANGRSMVDADRAMWDFNPTMVSRYVVKNRASQGRYYEVSPSHDFYGMVQLMKAYVDRRTSWMDQTLLTDRDFPNTPSLSYTGPAGYPADQLAVRASAFSDPQGNNTFAAMQWRAAELVAPGRPGYNANTRGKYEIEATWLSPEMPVYNASASIPHNACQAGLVCRVRVRMMDNTGRWSHWSAPVEFVAGAPTAPPVTGLRFSELMYKPAESDALPGDDLEFLELENTTAAAIDLSGMHFTAGIEYTFATGASIAPGAHLVLAKHAGYFQARYGFAPYGEYDKELSNKGERILLADAFGAPVLDVTYGDSGDWPSAADGDGYSLTPVSSAGGDPNQPGYWRPSGLVGGSPGASDPLPVLLNEFAFDASTGNVTAVELYNPGQFAADVGGWVISTGTSTLPAQKSAAPDGVRVPPGSTVPANGYLVVPTKADAPLRMQAGSTTMTLFSVDFGIVSGYLNSADLENPPNGTTLGRLLTSDGAVHFAPQRSPSLGNVNVGPQVAAVVISRLTLASAQYGAAIELLNTSNDPVNLYEPADLHRTWTVGGVIFQIPQGITLPSNGRLLLTSRDPSVVCQSGQVPAGVRISGPIDVPPTNRAANVILLQPIDWGGKGRWALAVVDEVRYRNAAPWPAVGSGQALARADFGGYGAEPLSWVATGTSSEAGQPAAPDSPSVCAFDVFMNPRRQMEIQWVAKPPSAAMSFRLLRSTLDNPAQREVIAPQVAVAHVSDSVPALYKTIDETADQGQQYLYWLQAVGIDNSAVDIAFTAPRGEVYRINAPVVGR